MNENTNPHKIRAIVSAFLAGLSGFFNWLATVPVEQQSGMLAQLVEIVPVEWRPNVGLATRLLMWGLGIYSAMQASKAGPAASKQ